MSQYIGRRIVPVHGGVWDNSKNYEELTIVLHEASGDSYISRRPVPVGTVIGDKNYWMLYSLYSQQIADAVAQMEETDTALRKELSDTESRMEKRVAGAENLTNSNKAELNGRMDGIDKRLDANVAASTEKNADYAAEVVDARVHSNGTEYANLGAHMRALDSGNAVETLDAYKVQFPDVSMRKFYELASEKGGQYFEYSYDSETDTLRLSCVKDYSGDYILYAPLLSPKNFAFLRKLNAKLLVKYRTVDVVNNSKAFKFGLWLGRSSNTDNATAGSIFNSLYYHAFANGSEDNEDLASLTARTLDYDAELQCYLYNGQPVNLQLLLYANDPKEGETISVSGTGGMIYGIGANAALNAFFGNMIRADIKEQKAVVDANTKEIGELDERLQKVRDNDCRDCQILEFCPSSVFAPGPSEYEKTEDEYGDQSYKMTFADNNPMYQMNLTDFLADSCREVIVELTARRLSESGKLRIQLYDKNCGMTHMRTSMYFALTNEYRRYQFRLDRVNAGTTALGIGPERIVGVSVQFKNVQILIPNEGTKQVQQPLKYFYGYPDDIDFTELKAVTLNDPLICGTDDYTSKDGLYLDSVEIYATKQYGMTFYVGCIDQYGLLQQYGTFSAQVRKGRNFIKFDDQKISVPSGCGIFAKWDADMAVYPNARGCGFHNLISTKTDYFENEQGYSGYPLKESDYMVPMRFVLVEKTLPVKLDEMEDAITEMREESVFLDGRVSDLEENSGQKIGNALIGPDGVKYYLTANADGAISTIRSIPNKAVVFGNSLTAGFGTFGMAASDSKHDYYFYVRQFLLERNGALEMERHGASTWEGKTNSEERTSYVQTLIDSYLDGTEDLIIIQLSDNVNTDEKRATFPEDVHTLLRMLRTSCPKARIVWVAAWYGWNVNYEPIEKACVEMGIDLVDIRDLSTVAANKSAIGNTYTKDDGTVVEITSSGVASHPGDTGMKLIAERIIAVLESYM